MRKKEPLLSFVVPVYKKPVEVFDACLHSLFDMSYKNIEVICVFDGADSELESVANKYPVQVHVVDHGGAPRARNYGFTKATGEYISFWDADCYAKPEMARIWMETFAENPRAAFVYSGYEFTLERGAIETEIFDPYLLQCGNFIATMFPMKREFFPGFDESLTAAQDWDMWLTVVERGGIGVPIQGYGFVTEYPDKDSISGRGWSPENREETIRRVKEKHGIPERDTVVCSVNYKMKALHLAKLLNADFVTTLQGRPHKYACVLVLGVWEDTRFQNAPADCVKIQYWLPMEINGLEEVAYSRVVKLLRNLKKEATANLCNEIVSQKRLADLGIDPGMGVKAAIVPLPTEIDDLEKALPEKFRVLLDIGEAYKPLFKDIRAALPYIDIDELEFSADITKYSLLVSFHPHPTVDEGVRRFLLNGRNVISNVAAPYCGYMDLEIGYGEFKDKIIAKIRAARTLPFNAAAQAHYKKLADPDAFRRAIEEIRTKATKEAVA